MSASLSSHEPTWHVVLPWMDQLAPDQLLALQRMGGPAQWWLHETPEETSARRPHMDDVFDEFASFLGWGGGPVLDEKPLHLLLPFLPVQMATSELRLPAKALDVLQAAGGRTLGEVGRLTPLNIVYLAKIHADTKRDILAALVRVAVTSPRRSPAGETVLAPAAEDPLSAGPDKAISRWFAGLDARQRDLITLHLCAADPVSVDELAARYRTMRPWMIRLLDELPQQLQSAAQTSAALASALKVFDSATHTPITSADLLDHHPWLAALLPGSEVSVVDLVLALHWSGSSDGEWLFAGSLAHARKITRNALGLAPGDSLSLTAATRLLEETGRPLRATEPWLRYCGLRLSGDWQVELDVAEPTAVHLPATAAAGDSALSSSSPADEAASRRGPGEDPPAFADDDSLPAATVSDDAPTDFMGVLEQLRALAYEHRPGEQLGDLLRDSEELPEPWRTLLARVLAAVAGNDSWELPDDTDALEAPDDHVGIMRAGSVSEGGSRSALLTDRAFAVLDEANHALEWQLLVERMGPDVNVRALKTQLSRDSRFMRNGVNSWALTHWGLRPYTSIKELIAQEVDLADGSISTDELVAILTREFTVAESSVRVVASSPPFTSRGGVVRRLSDVRREERAEPVEGKDSGSSDDGPSSDDLINLMGLG